jgi:NADPH:quinone reductase-like Zn-dependent oxidoreductase
MTDMAALIFNGATESVRVGVSQVPVPVPKAGEALVRLSHGALNRRDTLIAEGQYLADMPRSIMGSDGSGILVEANGETVVSVGEHVVINPVLNWGDSERIPNRSTIRTLGVPNDGTIAEYIAITCDNIRAAPAHLTSAEAAALPLAGLTAYRALFTRGELQPNETVVLPGIGGGVSLIALQLATAFGARAFVTSRTQEHLDVAMEHGASGGVLTTEEGWSKSLKAMTGGADLIVDSIGGEQFATMLQIAREGGRIVTLGAVTGNVSNFPIPLLFYKQLDIRGTSVGSPREFDDLLALVTKHKIHPVISQTFAIAQAVEALDFLVGERPAGKVIIEMPTDQS